MIITIDGPAGAGKSTIASELARRLAIGYLDTGAMYRALTLAALRKAISLDDDEHLREIAESSELGIFWEQDISHVLLDGEDVTDAIREPEVTAHSHKIAKNVFVRDVLVEQQRHIAEKAGSIVTEGRDQGTIVFPNAEVKFFLDACSQERAQRRYKQLKEKQVPVTFEEIHDAIVKRDERDSQRDVAPLKKADDAILIDSSNLTIEQVLEKMCERVKEKQAL